MKVVGIEFWPTNRSDGQVLVRRTRSLLLETFPHFSFHAGQCGAGERHDAACIHTGDAAAAAVLQQLQQQQRRHSTAAAASAASAAAAGSATARWTVLPLALGNALGHFDCAEVILMVVLWRLPQPPHLISA